MLEADIVRRIVTTLNKMPQVFCFRTHGSAFQMKGTPDIIGLAYGHFFAIEAKRTAKDKPSAAQLYVLSKISKAGGTTFVSHDPSAKEVISWRNSLQES